MALTNCTISSLTITSNVSEAIGANTGTMTITPNTGYVLSASNFTNNTSVKPEIATISLADSSSAGTVGNTVVVTILFNPGFVMPAAGSNVEIDIDGAATQNTVAVSGKFNMINSNSSITIAGYNSGSGTITNAASSPDYIGGSWSNTGNEGTTETVLTITCTASTNYTFEDNEPIVELSSSDNFTTTKTGSGSDPRVFTITYKYPSSGSDNNEITVYSDPVSSPTVATSIKGYNYDIKQINSKGASREVNIYGSQGATYDLLVTKDQSEATYGLPINKDDATFIYSRKNIEIGSKGFSTQNVIIPESSTDETIVFTLTGSALDSSIVTDHSAAVWTLLQRSKVSFTLSPEETGGSTFNAVTDIVLGTGEFDELTTSNVDGTIGDAFTNVDIGVASAGGNNIFAKVNPVYAANLMTNKNRGGWSIVVTDATYTNLGSSSVKVTISGRIEKYGNSSITSVLNLADIFKDNSGADTASRNGLTTNYSVDTTAHTKFSDASTAAFVVGDNNNGWAGSEPTSVYHFYDNASTDADKLTLTSGKYYKFKIGAWNGTESHYIGLAAATNTLTKIVKIN